MEGSLFAENEGGTTSVDDLRALKIMFEFFDTDNDGSISLVELGDAIRSIGHNPSKDVIEGMFEDVAKDDKGGICFNDFLGIMTSHVPLEVEDEYSQELCKFIVRQFLYLQFQNQTNKKERGCPHHCCYLFVKKMIDPFHVFVHSHSLQNTYSL
eukprot:m.8837 g.8837  ORF g.8837 m.8837 type:complete len:154 (-) comp6237_c0_seq1:454-915(-)